MRSSTWRLEDLRNVILNLGFVGENLHTRQIFDCKKIFDQYPQASVSMTVTPPEGEPYPGTIERDGDLVIWDVRDSDLVAEGDGEIQLVFTQEPHIARSYNARTHICRSQVPTGSIPSGLDDYITRADQLLDQVEDTFPAGGTTGQVLAKKSDADYDTEWVDQGAGGTSDYDELENRPQIGGVTLTGNKTLHDLGAASEAAVEAKYTKPETGIPASDMAAGVIPDPEDLIDDEAGSGDTDKVWSADKSHELLTEINSKMDEPETEGTSGQVLTTDGNGGRSWTTPSGGVSDVKINGTSVVSQGEANVPLAGSSTVGGVKVSGGGLQVDQNGQIRTDKASENGIKDGTNWYSPIVPFNQHQSVFYALAKLAGADMALLSGETVGVYPDAQKVAIQKMLGIYEAPWELIREDTVTNATEADIEITVDGDGNPFELTELILLFETPKQNNASGKGDYGNVKYYYGNTYISMISNAWTQNANAAANGISSIVENKNGLIIVDIQQYTSSGGSGNVRRGYKEGFSGTTQTIQVIQDFAVTKVNITKVTGTGHYKLYGKRKWTA